VRGRPGPRFFGLATIALDAIADTALDEIGELIEERTRLWRLALDSREGADGQA
jgi:hypothetical protein